MERPAAVPCRTEQVLSAYEMQDGRLFHGFSMYCGDGISFMRVFDMLLGTSCCEILRATTVVPIDAAVTSVFDMVVGQRV